MKNYYKLLVPVLLLFMISGPMLETLSAQNKPGLDLKVHVEWGRKSKGCHGFGICIFIESIELTGVLFARLLPDEDVLLLNVPMEMVRKSPEQFDQEAFIMEEDFMISDEVSKSLGAQRSLVIPRGKYPIDRSGKSCLVSLSLK